MKIKEYNQMMSYLTRPGVPKKDNKMEDEKKIAEKQMIKVAQQPDSRGVFKKAVQEEEKLFENIIDNLGKPKPKPLKPFISQKHLVETLDKYEDNRDFNDKRGERFINKTLKPVEQNTDPRGVAFNPTTQLFTNKDRTVAFKSYDEADTWNKSIGVNKTKYYQDEATPEQVGALATRLERSRQMNGGDGRYDKPKAIIKKKKIVAAPLPKFVFEPMILPEPIQRSAEDIQREENFQRLKDDVDRNKLNREFGGIRGLIRK